MSPVRLLFVSHSFLREDARPEDLGGMERAAHEWARALRSRPGVQLEVLGLRTRRRFRPWVAPWFLAVLAATLGRRIRRLHPDVVLFSSATTALVTLFLEHRRGNGAPRLAAVAHGNDVVRNVALYRRIVRRALVERCDVVFPVSRATARACVELGVPPGRIRVVPNGVARDRFPGELARRTGEPRGFPSDGTHRLLSVGRLVRRKGYAWFAGAVLPRLSRGVEWVLAGSGPERGRVLRAAQAARVGGRLVLAGSVPEGALPGLYGSADLVVMPNLSVPGEIEGFGLVALEAAAAGVPVVASDLEGLQDAVVPGVTGLRVPPGDAPAFASAVSSLLEDPAERWRLGTRARDHVLKHCTWARVADRLLEALANGT